MFPFKKKGKHDQLEEEEERENVLGLWGKKKP